MGEVQRAAFAAGEYDERRRADGSLRGIQDLALLEMQLLHPAVQFAGGDAPRSCLIYLVDQREQPCYSRARLGGNEFDRRIFQKLEHVANILLEFVLRAVLQLVPLVDANDQRASAFVGIAGDGGIVGGDAFHRIEHQQHHVRHANVAPRHHHAQLFRHQLGLALAPYAGGVDENVLDAIALHSLIHRVARGAGHWGNDSALLPGERVQQRRLAHVRPADDGHLDRWGLRRRRGLAGREPRGHMIEQGVHTGGVLRRNRVDIGDAELVERVRQVLMRDSVGFVDRQR